MVETGEGQNDRNEILKIIDRTLLGREGSKMSGDEFYDEALEKEDEKATQWLEKKAAKIDRLILQKMKNWKWDPKDEYVHYLTMKEIFDGYDALEFDEKKLKKDMPRKNYKDRMVEGFRSGTIQALQEFLRKRYKDGVTLEKTSLRKGNTQHEEWILSWPGLINR